MQFFISLYFLIFLFFPIFILFFNAIQAFWINFWLKATSPVALCTYQVSFSLSFIACIINTLIGFLIAWVLIRYKFPGKKIFDTIIDLPFSIPTSVAGLSFYAIYGNKGWIGNFLVKKGIYIIFSKFGILFVMIFVSFPFVIRSLQPALLEIDRKIEEAAWSLGANSWLTFTKVLFPILLPALFTGMVLSFSRCIGEYGAIVLISSNSPLKDLITPVLIFQCLEQYDYTGATVLGSVLLFLCFCFFFLINIFYNYLK